MDSGEEEAPEQDQQMRNHPSLTGSEPGLAEEQIEFEEEQEED